MRDKGNERPPIIEDFKRFAGAEEFLQSLNEGWVENAVDLLRNLVEKDPGNRTIPYFMALLAENAGRFVEALQHLNRLEPGLPFQFLLPLLVRTWKRLHLNGVVIRAFLHRMEDSRGIGESESLAIDCLESLDARGRHEDIRRVFLPMLDSRPDWKVFPVRLAVAAVFAMPEKTILEPDEISRLLDAASGLSADVAATLKEVKARLAKALDGSLAEEMTVADAESALAEADRCIADYQKAALVGEVPDSERMFLEVLGRCPAHTKTLTALGCLLDKAGLRSEGYDLHRWAFELDPLCPQVLNNLGWHEAQRGNRDEAVRLWEKAVAIDPGLFQAYNSLGVFYDNVGDYERGLAAFRRCDELVPNRGVTLWNMSYALRKLGQHDEARVCLERAIGLSPTQHDLHIQLADVYLDMRCPDEALACLDRFSASTANAWNECVRYLIRLGRARLMRRESTKVGEVVERLKRSAPEQSTDFLEMAEFLAMVDRGEALKVVTGFLSVEWNATVAHEVERARKLRAELLAGMQ